MLELWKLKRQRKQIFDAYEKDIKSAIKRKAPADERGSIEAQQYFELRDIDQLIDQRTSDRLLQRLRSLDLEWQIAAPDEEGGEDVWHVDEHTTRAWLSPHGRLITRQLIDGEKSRRFDAKTKWAKLLLPLITALAGLLGVITGLIAVLKK